MFTLLCVNVGLLIVVEFIVIFFSSKDDTPADMPATWRPFSKLTSLARLLRSLEAPFKQAVQAASESVTKSLSQSMPCRVKMAGKLNFRVVKRGVGMNLVGIADWKRIDPCLYWVWILLHKFH